MGAEKFRNSKRMTEKVWVSRAMMDEALVKPMISDIGEADIERAVDTIKRNDKGEPLSADKFPKEIYGNEDAGVLSSMPDFFFADAGWVVSSASAKVLREFDLGDGALYPVKLFEKDRETPLDGVYFCLNFGAVKEAFLPAHSPKAMADPYRDRIWTLPFVIKDDYIAVSAEALEGPDMWVDPMFERAFFVSDILARALKSAKVNKAFGLRRCRVIVED